MRSKTRASWLLCRYDVVRQPVLLGPIYRARFSFRAARRLIVPRKHCAAAAQFNVKEREGEKKHCFYLFQKKNSIFLS